MKSDSLIRTSKRWGVIGGGILGLTIAHRLNQAGEEVTLFEGAERLGGLASAWKLGDITWDRHYHVTLFSDAHLRWNDDRTKDHILKHMVYLPGHRAE